MRTGPLEAVVRHRVTAASNEAIARVIVEDLRLPATYGEADKVTVLVAVPTAARLSVCGADAGYV